MQRVSEELVHRYGDTVTVFTTDCLNGEAFFTPDLPHLPIGSEDRNGVHVRRFPVRRRISRLLRTPQAIAYRLRLPGNEHLRALAGGPIITGLRRAIRDAPVDLVAASSFPLLHMFDTVDGAHDAGRPAVLHGGLHPHDAWGFDRPRIYRAIRRADAYIANTSWEADYVIARGADRRKVFAVGVGVDPELYEGVDAADAKFRLGFDRHPLVGFIGQIGGHKGVDALMRAMPIVWRRHPEVNLLVAGGRTLFTPHVERTIASWPTDRQARTRLFVDFPAARKPWLFRAIDVFAYPSGFESFGISFLEAWAAKKPVIGTTNGAIPTVVDHGATGLLVPFQDEHALAAAILDMLDDPAAAARMGNEGYARTLARHTWPYIAAQFREIYARVLER
jgi:glycosyltransferase involved in cell wall biosynthesis